MRIIIFSLAAIPLFALDTAFLFSFPQQATRFYSMTEAVFILIGAVVYGLLHFVVRKPERMYVWGHEFSHLLVAKLFLRRVHGFHISSRDGGKVVMDGTNVMIDLAPYIIPFYSLLAVGVTLLFSPEVRWFPGVYLLVASFLYTMHLVFSMEGFFSGQPDLLRSGRFFSFSISFFFMMIWIPLIFAPGISGGWKGIELFYREWISSGAAEICRLFAVVKPFFRRFL